MKGNTCVHIPVLIRLRYYKSMHDRINNTDLAWRSRLPRDCKIRAWRLAPSSPRIKEGMLTWWEGLILRVLWQLLWCNIFSNTCTPTSAIASVVVFVSVGFLAAIGASTLDNWSTRDLSRLQYVKVEKKSAKFVFVN
ncbi:unnamed protein product [Sphenostylis stenocarpa]|uniref:Uncharacterized protein n=1 Tax=Sphenostylis stenocarpa TaxID=92480 RepID=A0AA86VED6_9FABA|nr:unnamed protein product [Sphenostylis stenocarpa]